MVNNRSVYFGRGDRSGRDSRRSLLDIQGLIMTATSGLGQVEVLADKKGYFFFKTTCACGAEDLTVFVDYDDENDYLNIYYDTHWCGDSHLSASWWSRIRQRFVAGLRVWFTGRLETHSTFLFRDAAHVLAFSEALCKAVEGHPNMGDTEES